MTRKAPAFQLYVDDFLSGTIDMSAEEVGVYIRLLCIQWSKGIVTQRAANVCGGSSEAINFVLAEKFTCIQGGFVNQRLETVRRLSEERAKIGSKGGINSQANRQANAEANDTAKLNPPTPTPTPNSDSSSSSSSKTNTGETPQAAVSVNPKTDKPRKPKPEPADCPEGVDQQAWADWLAVRQRRRAGPPTATVIASIATEATKCGMTMGEAIRHAAANEWRGFKAEWVEIRRAEPRTNMPKTFVQQRVENSQKAMEDFVNG